MNKEEYLHCYGNIRDAMKNICLSCQENERCKGCDVFGDLHKLRKIIHEHFELVELLKKLNELRDIKPYKFEDLKHDMWVWDDVEKKCNKIIEILENKKISFYYITENFSRYIVKFEENRFYPLTKAMCQEVKQND